VPSVDQRHDALGRIVQSAFLDRAPNLVLLLKYVCEQTFAGRSGDIKEYNIAVDALGRGSDFDPKKDAIVRVEAHRLRKRLADYYATLGAGDPVEISLPSGTYVPRFAFRAVADPVVVAIPVPVTVTPSEASAPSSVPVAPPKRRAHPVLLAVAAITAVVIVGGLLFWRVSGGTAAQRPVSSGTAVPAALADGAVRVLCGSDASALADREGAIWSGDRFFSGGWAMTTPPRPIGRTTTPELYLTRREGEFSYRIPLRPGSYELRLHFAETVFGEGNIAGGGESSRVFSVTANGVELPISDILAEAGGPNIANVRVFRGITPASDGFLHLDFRRVKENAIVNAIEVVPVSSGRLLPVRIAAQPSPFKSSGGEPWGGDRFYAGGQPVARQEAVAGAVDPRLFHGERFGNFTYDIPVDPTGRYSLTLHFAEMWFGPGRPGGGGDSSRLFDVYCNGRTLLRNFDVFRTAGGSLRAVTKTFRGLEPSAQGKLHLAFVPVKNYAMVSAIEVIDETR
jgi:hypothetical protein